jgi:hypothetical protein
MISRPRVTLPRNYVPALRLLVADLEEAFEYVEPVDENLKAFSHRFYALLLRACTEVESLLKEYGQALRGSKRRFRDMRDYAKLEQDYQLSRIAVDALMWMPKVRRIQPFAEWSGSAGPLSWYQSYNAVKHDRSTNFREATVENTLAAVAGAFLLTALAEALPSDGAHLHRPGGAWDDRRGFKDFPFELVGAWS